jgi:hypothetical protein
VSEQAVETRPTQIALAGVEGILQRVESAGGLSTDRIVTSAPGWPTYMLLLFRPVDATGPMKRRH